MRSFHVRNYNSVHPNLALARYREVNTFIRFFVSEEARGALESWEHATPLLLPEDVTRYSRRYPGFHVSNIFHQKY